MKKIKLTCSWCDDKALYNRFSRVYINSLNKNSSFSLTPSDDFDFLVIINYPHYPIKFPKERTLGVIMEPSWNEHFELSKNLPMICEHILFHKHMNTPHYIYYPGLLPYHIDYNEGADMDYYLNASFLNQKTKKCSVVVTHNDNNRRPGSIYNERVNFVKKLLKTDLDIDVYGNNWQFSGITDQRIKGPLENKKDGLLDYKFSIAIENCVEEGYFTEKLTDCILTDTMPIYYGCPDIHTFFPTVLTLPDLQNTNNVVEFLNKQDYQLPDKTKLATKFNLYTAITKYFNTWNNPN